MITRVSITRPANTTAYAIGDVINADIVTVPIVLPYGESALEPWVLLSHLISTNELATPAIDIYFFANSFTIAADNAAFAPSDSDMQNNFLGKISHTTWSAFAANKVSSAKPEAPIELSPASLNGGVYVVLVAAAAYTPISGEVLTVKVDIQR